MDRHLRLTVPSGVSDINVPMRTWHHVPEELSSPVVKEREGEGQGRLAAISCCSPSTTLPLRLSLPWPSAVCVPQGFHEDFYGDFPFPPYAAAFAQPLPVCSRSASRRARPGAPSTEPAPLCSGRAPFPSSVLPLPSHTSPSPGAPLASSRPSASGIHYLY